MSQDILVTIVGTVCVLLGGQFGKTLLQRWFDRGRDRDKERSRADAEERGHSFTDNEQARKWLSDQLDARGGELNLVLERERALLDRVGKLEAQIGRYEERTTAQATQLEEMRHQISRWHEDYDKIEHERDGYRAEKHEATQELTKALLRAQLAEREVEARNQEIDRLKGQLAALAGRGET